MSGNAAHAATADRCVQLRVVLTFCKNSPSTKYEKEKIK